MSTLYCISHSKQGLAGSWRDTMIAFTPDYQQSIRSNEPRGGPGTR